MPWTTHRYSKCSRILIYRKPSLPEGFKTACVFFTRIKGQVCFKKFRNPIFLSVTPTKSSGISASAIGGVCSRDITAKSSIFPQKWYRLSTVWRFHLAVKYVIVTSDSFHSLYSFFPSDLLTLTTFVRRYAYCTILKVIDLLENSSSTRTKF